MSGWENQEAGDWGEGIVKAALSGGRITSASLDPDLGEDLLIEVAGREASATGSHAKAALVQVKACFQECKSDEIKVSGIKKTKLMRWSSQQLPVFVVAVPGFSTRTPRFYVKAVDEFLEENFSGVEIRDIARETLTVTARHTEDIANWLINKIEDFHRAVDADLAALSTSDKRNEHFEIVRRGKPDPLGQMARHVSWKVIWSSRRRPAYFAAMIAELFREAHQTYADLNAPAYVSFHIYRSQYDMTHNMAVARVHWIDDLHPRFALAARAVDRQNPTIEYVETLPEYRVFVESMAADASVFVGQVKLVAPKFDEFARKLLAAEADGERGKEFWTAEVIAEMEELESLWDNVPLAPPEFNTLQEVLSSYVEALTGHRIFAGKAHWNPKGESERYRLETAEEVQCYYGTWWVLLKNSGWSSP
ncbi:hypothetical protein ACYFX5_01515 [Bremerella sp. T1]|uniref:hypothetical protein n=1 Tax=Bremerella sp. TYQ1 TaxID=3119568 RepID=UPI001CCBDFF7|nr:hypothetical protein [Bremerella volcania]UBM36962.1 hypothetical protein LA756_03475 [Bremerella volcania]